jgi:hypothetical protein
MNITEIPIDSIKKIELFDIIILHHGFEEYNRDYYFLVESATKEQRGIFKLNFTHCFDLKYRHKFADKEHPDLLRRSWDDHLILPDTSDTGNAYWWGQGFTTAYPGFSYDPNSIEAKEMTDITGRPMYAAKLETDHYCIDFVFHDFKFKFLNTGTPISDKIIIPVKDFKFKK